MNGLKSMVSIMTPKIQIYADFSSFFLGDMVYFEVLGQSFLVLGSPKRTGDLFEKRSSIYSDRMRMPMVLEL